jgi:kinesin family protein 3/17
MKGKKSGKSECVKVAIRVRPMNKHEIEQNSKLCVQVDVANSTVSVISDKNESKTFPLDYVYPMETTQREVYDQVAFPIVDSIFQGYNGTVFAYGQTGCGKTFTMMGVVTDPDLKGIIPNAFSHIFGFIKTEGESKKFFLRCSFVEIYNEEVRDLLGNKDKKLDIREDPKKGTVLRDLTYVTIKNPADIEKCLEKGNKNRHVGHTSMNDQSSRSHSLFTVYLEIEEKAENGNSRIKSGKLNLVDLAGSERVGKTNATGQTFDEGKKINLSLTALGSVIDALSQNRKYVPYKDSKLTRLLADSLGGNTKTVMFANISPASYNYDETLGTLRYASRAKLIKNAPVVNEDPKDALLRK